MHRDGSIVIVGAGPTARALAGVLVRTNRVCLVDSNREHCTFARSAGLASVCGSALDKEVLKEAGVEEAGKFIALTPNAEVNALAAQMAHGVFGVPDLHVHCGSDRDGHAALREHLQVTTLFGGSIKLTDWDYWIGHDAVERLGVTLERLPAAAILFEELQAHSASLPLAVRRADRYLPFHGGIVFERHDRVIVLRANEGIPPVLDRFDRLVSRCPVLDLDRRMEVEEFFELAAASLANTLDLSAELLTERFLDRETASSTVIAPGLAIPHVLIEGISDFHLLIARSREGISFPGQDEAVHAVFVLVRSVQARNFHLRALAAIAQVVQDPDFETDWLTAAGPEQLRTIVLKAERRRFPEEARAPA
jgi:Trk K+ transport system NAD-binding subunit/mannitol/fructose-specific phosphotransferase system IIA component (Ntr-type)